MYIRRKVFSRFIDESGEEKLFSTTDYTLMSEAEQREFSEDKKSDEEELAKEDKKIIKYWQKKRRKETAALKQAALEGDKEAQKKLTKKAYKWGMIREGAIGAGIGAITGSMAHDDESRKSKIKGALRGAAVGGALGTGLGALIGKETKEGWKHQKKTDSRNAQSKINSELEHDQLALANGKMTKKEFIKKWGN